VCEKLSFSYRVHYPSSRMAVPIRTSVALHTHITQRNEPFLLLMGDEPSSYSYRYIVTLCWKKKGTYVRLLSWGGSPLSIFMTAVSHAIINFEGFRTLLHSLTQTMALSTVFYMPIAFFSRRRKNQMEILPHSRMVIICVLLFFVRFPRKSVWNVLNRKELV